MKKYVSLFLSVMLMFVASACTSDDALETSKVENSEEQWHHVTMSLDISKENFDAKGTASTRATSDEWQDGDKLYLRFVTYNGIVIGNAIYDSKKRKWNVSYEGTLNKNIESQLFVVFLDNIENENPIQDGVIPLDCYHGVYMDEHGTYVLDTDGSMVAKATLKSATSRVRFKGDTPKMNFKLIGVTYYVGYNPQNHTFTTSTEVLKNQTNEDKESDYIYVQQLTEENRQIMLGRTYEDGNYIFKAVCSKEIFVAGKSGVLCIPSKSQHKGWDKSQVSGIDEDGHGWVDLDLPSGIIWATENFGADLSKWQTEGDGKYLLGNQCMWGSVDYTNWSPTMSDIGGTAEDIVTMAWGKKWRIPSYLDLIELARNTKDTRYSDYYLSTSNCRLSVREFVGKNDEAMLWVEGYNQGGKDYGSNGYWSSTPSNVYAAEAGYITSPFWGNDIGTSSGEKSKARCIRPIVNSIKE